MTIVLVIEAISVGVFGVMALWEVAGGRFLWAAVFLAFAVRSGGYVAILYRRLRKTGTISGTGRTSNAPKTL